MAVSTHVVFVPFALVALASAINLKPHTMMKADTDDVFEGQSYRQVLQNFGDAQYTGKINIGGQDLNSVFDTGSFELLAFSTNCTVCGPLDSLYNESKSSSFIGSDFTGEQSFGSGYCYSTEAKDKIRIGPLGAFHQGFWEVHDASMPILADSSFQAILGLGPPSSAVKYAEADNKDVHKELNNFMAGEREVSPAMWKLIHHYDDVLKHAQEATSFAATFNLHNFSVCLGKATGSAGYFVWNDTAPQELPSKFLSIDVVGETYWSAQLSGVHFADRPGATKAEHALNECENGYCAAVFDTGTSLIVTPSYVSIKINKLVQNWLDAGGTCADLSALPDMKFQLNNHSFSLPPESYVGTMKGHPSKHLEVFMPKNIKNGKVIVPKDGSTPDDAEEQIAKVSQEFECKSLVMSMDSHSDKGPLWIFGMPFFRKYYTSFHFRQQEGKSPIAKAMSFSMADEECKPGKYPEEDDTLGHLLIAESVQAHYIQNLDASKIRVPRQVNSNRSLLFKDLPPFVRV